MRKYLTFFLALIASTTIAWAQDTGGDCGLSLHWYMNSSMTLIIYGNGDMDDYSLLPTKQAPWADYYQLLLTVEFPEGMTRVGSNAFWNFLSLQSITIPSTVTSIGENAFYQCDGAKSLTFAEGSQLNDIGLQAFCACKDLTSINIPGSVTFIGFQAFGWCDGLKDVTVNWTNLSGVNINATAFDEVPLDNVNLHVPAGTYATYAAAEPWKKFKIKDPTYSGKCGENLTWEYDPSTTTLTISGTGAMTDYNSLSDVPWKEYKPNITSIVLPNGLTHIGARAFYSCKNTALTSIDIPNSVTSFGDFAFLGCYGLTSFTISSNVTSIGQQALKDCKGLTSIEIPSSITTIANNLFAGCTGLTSVTLPSTITSLESNAFRNCTSLTSFTIPASVQTIENYAFMGCTGLTHLYVNWDSPITPGTDAFKDLDLSKITLHVPYGTATTYQAAPVWQDFHMVEINPSGKCGENLTWEYDPSTTTLTISGTGAMNEYVNSNSPWRKYDEITTVVIESGATSIGANAFLGCAALTAVTIPASVTIIGKSAFNGCSALTDVTIPVGVTSIGEQAFMVCSSLTAVTIPASVNSIGKYAFWDCAGLDKVTFAEGSLLTDIGEKCFRECIKLTSINIPAGVTSIGDQAFYKCTSLTSIAIPAGVTGIGNYAFSGSPALTTVTFAENSKLTSIGDYAFYKCTSLTAVTIPNSVTSIGERAFYECALTSITIPNGVTTISTYAFQYCDKLTEIHLPATVTSLGDNPFCAAGLTAITVDPANTVYSSPDGSNAIIETATNKLVSGCQNTVIPSDVKIIGYSAFEGCSNMSSLDIPEGVDSISSDAFYNCTGLTDLYVHWTADPPVPANADAFYKVIVENVNLHVPPGTKDIYLAVDPWKNFKIIEEETPTGLEGIQSTEYRVQKLLRNGQLFIERNGVRYNALGGLVD